MEEVVKTPKQLLDEAIGTALGEFTKATGLTVTKLTVQYEDEEFYTGIEVE